MLLYAAGLSLAIKMVAPAACCAARMLCNLQSTAAPVGAVKSEARFSHAVDRTAAVRLTKLASQQHHQAATT
jgi:hypothetical protein